VQAYRYWRLKLKQSHGQTTSSTVLQQLRHTCDIQDSSDEPIPQDLAAKNLKCAYRKMTDCQKNSEQLRVTFLEELAEAIVLNNNSSLANADLCRERTLHQLKQLQFREKMRRAYRQISHTLAPQVPLGLDRVDVPDGNVLNTQYGDPTKPKTWSGPWVSKTDPEEIAQVVRHLNIAQYHQAYQTPFRSGPLADAIGRQADTIQANSLLSGSLQHLPIEDLMPETTRILHTLATPYPKIPEHSLKITNDDFIGVYKALKENTSSSPSGRHVGHYKAVVGDPVLVTMHAIMMTLPFLHGFVPDRWTKVTDIMLKKDHGSARCHRLRIIALFESDLNQAKRLLIGRTLSHHLEDSHLLPSMQFGSRRGRQSQSAVLQKVLCHDMTRIMKATTAFIENDAIGCYDQLVNNLILLLLARLGFAQSVCSCLGSLWDSTTHFIKTLYGTSSVTYSSTAEIPLFGPGQGSTTGPPSG